MCLILRNNFLGWFQIQKLQSLQVHMHLLTIRLTTYLVYLHSVQIILMVTNFTCQIVQNRIGAKSSVVS